MKNCICNQCGSELVKNAKFCMKCGASADGKDVPDAKESSFTDNGHLKKKKKRAKLWIILLLLLALLIAIAIFAVICVKGAEIQKQLDKSDKYLKKHDYKKAIKVYEEVLKIDSKNKEALNGLEDAYEDWVEELIEEGKYEKAQEVIEDFMDDVGEDNETAEELLEEVEELLEEARIKEALAEEIAAEEAIAEEAIAEEAPAEDAVPAEAVTTSDEKVQISVYRATYNLGQPDSAQVKKVQDAINAYIADKINVEITLTDIPSGEYADKANLALANNEINLLWTASWMGTIGTNDLYKSNAAYDISALLPGSLLYDSMPKSVWIASRYNGRDHFIPVYKEMYEGYDLKFPEWYAREFGLDTSAINELKDLEPYLEWCKNSKGLIYPYLVCKTPMFFRYYIDKYDFFTGTNSLFAIDRATDKVINPTLTGDYYEFCTLMSEWAEKGYISYDEVIKTTADNEAQTQNWGVTWWTCVPGDEWNSESRDGQEEVFVEDFTGKYIHSTTTLGSCYAITVNSTKAQAKACIDFLGLLYTDSYLADLYTYGIEGEDYSLNYEGKVVQYSDKYSHSPWESTSVVPVTPSDWDPDDKVWMYNDTNGSASASCAAGFRFNAAPVEAQLAACNNVFDLYGYNLELGGYAAADVADIIAEYNVALDEAGYQDVLAEFSYQYETWKKLNR